MTTKEFLLKQFAAAYDKNGWFVALANALKNLSAEQAAWKTENIENSIWETLSHLNFYNRAYVERFKGIDYDYSTDDNNETFAGADNPSEEAWAEEIENFERIMTEWRSLLETAAESKSYSPRARDNWKHFPNQATGETQPQARVLFRIREIDRPLL